MEVAPNIMKSRPTRIFARIGTVALGMLSVLASMSAGSMLADARGEARPVTGSRLAVTLHVAGMGPAVIRRAAIAVMADGVMTVGEERQLYWMLDETMRERRRITGHPSGETGASPDRHVAAVRGIPGSDRDDVRKDQLRGLASTELVDVGPPDGDDVSAFET